jgi:hypothetical protein
VKGPAGRSGRPGAVPDRRAGARPARPRRGPDLRAVQLDDQDRDGAGRIAAPDGGSAESGEHRLYRLRDALRTLSCPVTRLPDVGVLLSSKSAMKIFAPQVSALLTSLRSAGPVISTRRSTRPGASGATRQSPCRTSLVPAGNSGSVPPARSASRIARDSGSSARRGPNVACSTASSSSAPAVRTCSQPPSQDAPTSTPGTLGALLMRYPSQTCVRLAPQRRNRLTGTLVRDRQTFASWRPSRWVLSPSLPGRQSTGPVLLTHLVYATVPTCPA